MRSDPFLEDGGREAGSPEELKEERRGEKRRPLCLPPSLLWHRPHDS